ncbi:hypothetical protein BDZ91DRAFT_730417 [Kalaharituber pfeilii]|nr:hypothetical protein BDZ91DRAFT_730417 [Kalaharituber pfeilii]
MLIASIGPELEGLGRGVRVGLLHSNISNISALCLYLCLSSSSSSSFRFQTSHSIRTCAEVSRPLAHYLHSGLSAFPIYSPARVVTLVPRRCSGQ